MAGPIADNDQIHDLAVQALEAMLAKFGTNHRFPPTPYGNSSLAASKFFTQKNPTSPSVL